MTTFPLPPGMAERIAAFSGDPVPARRAATVVLLRSPRQAYAQRRHAGMRAFGGVWAFPGGAVEPGDALDDPGWGKRLGLPGDEAGAVVAAALREVHEETGVRLTGDALVPWSRWITPEFEARRFDTWFFVAALPAGADPQDVSGEADRVAWLDPADPGDLPMLPPTRVTLRELAAYPDIAAVLAADRDAARPVIPQIVTGPDGVARIKLSRSGR